MSPEDLEFYKKLLKKKREEALESMPDISDCHDPIFTGMDLADHATDVMDKSRNGQLVSREGRYLHHINEALDRIKKGTYGICRTCGDEIPKKRLEVVPNATQCIKCKNKEERKIRTRR